MSDMLRKLGVEVDIYGNVAGLKNIDASIAGITSKAKILGGVLAGAFAFHEIKNTISQSLAFADQFTDQAMRLGVSSEELQKWGFVAEQAGLSAETMGKGLSFLNKNLGEAQRGGEKAKGAIELFADVGIKQLKNSDGSFKSSGQILLEFSDHLAKLPTAAQKAAMGAKLMGRGGKELGVVLGQGSEAIQEQINLLMELGGVLPEGVGRQADRLKDKLNPINKAWEVTKAILIIKVVPAIVQFVTWIAKGTLWLRNLEERTGALSLGFGALAGMMAIFTARSVAAGTSFFVTWMRAALPFVIVAAELFLLFVIMQDLYYFVTGKGDSFMEDFIKQFYGLDEGTDAVNAIRAGFNDFLTVLQQVKAILGPIVELINNFKVGMSMIGLGNQDLRVKIPDELKKTLNVQGSYNFKGPSPLVYPGRPVFPAEKAANFLNTKQLETQMSLPQNIPLGANASGQTNNVSNIFNISGNDPQAIGTEVEKVLNRTWTNAKENFVTKKAAQ